MPFIDRCKIYIKAGNGGNGIVSWRHEAHVPVVVFYTRVVWNWGLMYVQYTNIFDRPLTPIIL